jgi:hypothetical protein
MRRSELFLGLRRPRAPSCPSSAQCFFSSPQRIRSRACTPWPLSRAGNLFGAQRYFVPGFDLKYSTQYCVQQLQIGHGFDDPRYSSAGSPESLLPESHDRTAYRFDSADAIDFLIGDGRLQLT